MKNLPEGMIPDRDNKVYWDTEESEFYIIKWEERGTHDHPTRYYIGHMGQLLQPSQFKRKNG